MAVFLNTETSVFQIAGPVKAFRFSLPKRITVPAAFAGRVVMPAVVENAATFMYRPAGTLANGSPITDGRPREQLQITENGNPERAVWMIFSCQPPTILSDAPLLFRYFCPLPKGKSMIASAERRLWTS